MPRGGLRSPVGGRPKKIPNVALPVAQQAAVVGGTLIIPQPMVAALAPRVVPAEAPLKVRMRGESPLEFMLRVMRNGKLEWNLRLRAAVAAAEYMHAKQPQAIHLTQETRMEAVVVHVHAGPWLPAAVEPAALPAAAKSEEKEP